MKPATEIERCLLKSGLAYPAMAQDTATAYTKMAPETRITVAMPAYW